MRPSPSPISLTLLAFLLGGLYDTWVVLGVAIVFLAVAMTIVMRVYGHATVPGPEAGEQPIIGKR